MVPMTYALGTSAATVRTAPLLLVDLETHEGVTGRAYQFCYTAAAAPAIMRFLDDIAEAVSNQVLAPADLWATLSKRYTLIGVQGIVRMAMSLVDVAAWDAIAPGSGAAAGALPRRRAAADPGVQQQRARADAGRRRLATKRKSSWKAGFRAVKLRLGYADARRRPRRRPRCAPASPRRRRGHG